MKAYPTEFEVMIDEETVFAKLKAFDDESFNVKMDIICSPADIRKLADALERCEKLLKDGI